MRKFNDNNGLHENRFHMPQLTTSVQTLDADTWTQVVWDTDGDFILQQTSGVEMLVAFSIAAPITADAGHPVPARNQVGEPFFMKGVGTEQGNVWVRPALEGAQATIRISK